MKRLAFVMFLWVLLLSAGAASANVLDISGPWIFEYPHGKGIVILKQTPGSTPSYRGEATIPMPSGKSLRFEIRLISSPDRIVPGEDAIFLSESSPQGISHIYMNFSSSGSGVGWVIASMAAYMNDMKDPLSITQQKVSIHR
ncbi:hypothetical protein [Thermanaerovibrio acidaminovorans]|uniref:hypothetical protein n=1 Tax=Thermanaerovibrio acidaminovorans TaxID=81462 RepID=UPI002492BEA4|nr:hypothetical protein [Thermanaerovibrio acidaminovorans]